MKYKNFEITARLGGLTPEQKGLFSPSHEKYYLRIKIKNAATGKTMVRRCTYQFNPCAIEFSAGDGILALVGDALCYAGSQGYDDFCDSFGYEEDRLKGWRAYRSCRASFTFFERAGLDADDLQAIRDEMDE